MEGHFGILTCDTSCSRFHGVSFGFSDNLPAPHSPVAFVVVDECSNIHGLGISLIFFSLSFFAPFRTFYCSLISFNFCASDLKLTNTHMFQKRKKKNETCCRSPTSHAAFNTFSIAKKLCSRDLCFVSFPKIILMNYK